MYIQGVLKLIKQFFNSTANKGLLKSFLLEISVWSRIFLYYVSLFFFQIFHVDESAKFQRFRSFNVRTLKLTYKNGLKFFQNLILIFRLWKCPKYCFHFKIAYLFWAKWQFWILKRRLWVILGTKTRKRIV